jgi:hypothetical protein
MLSHPAVIPQSSRRLRIGVDTCRFGHYAAFLRDTLQLTAEELQFPESAFG